MAKKKVDPLQAKAAKQKKIAIGGGVLLLLLVVLQGPGLMKKLKGPSGPDWRTAAPAATSTTATPGGLALPTLGGAAPVAAAPTAGPTAALVADTPPTAAVGQLASFGRFQSKDPFASQIPTVGTTTTPVPTPPSAPGSGTGGTGGTGATPGGGPAAPPTPPAPAPTSAVISVNGIQGAVTAGADFPQASDAAPTATPVFHLISLTQKTAKVAIAGGSYANGAPSLTLTVGKPVTLLNTADGSRYTLKLFPQGTQLPAAGASSDSGAVTPAPAAPASTTTTSSTTTSSTTTTP
jgi:hypothetical protein